MYCPKCGKIVDEGVKFCPYCGESLVKSENKTSNTNFTNENFTNNKINNNFTTNKTKERKKVSFLKNTSTKRKCCYVFIILLIIFMATYVIN
ncbi:MAG: zinc ribbon domain-containing protein [archaeon]|nr:zinc ribbon domain-containing protein [archaeon]